MRGNLLPDRLELAKRNGYRHTSRIALKPGLYQIRVGLREISTERIGTAMAWIEVPNLRKGKLTLSSLFLGERLSTSQQASTAEGAKFSGPTATQPIKVYSSKSSLVYYFMIYNASAKKHQEGSELMMQSELIQDEKPIYQSGWQPVASRIVGKNKKGLEVAGQISLDNVEPGIYELRVTVKDPISTRTAQQVAALEVGS